MTATPFALVSAENRDKIFAYGLDIELDSGREVITYRRDSNGQNMFSVHQSVEAAQARFSIITPLELAWQPSCRCCLCITGEEDCELDGACSNHPDTFPRT